MRVDGCGSEPGAQIVRLSNDYPLDARHLIPLAPTRRRLTVAPTASNSAWFSCHFRERLVSAGYEGAFITSRRCIDAHRKIGAGLDSVVRSRFSAKNSAAASAP